MLRKLPVLLLAICFIASYGLAFWGLQIQKGKIRSEINERIKRLEDAGTLIHMKFTSAELKSKLQWKHSKEFKFNNKMYDIVFTEKHGDIISLWVILDHKETRINKKIRDLISKVMGNHSDAKEKQKLSQDYFKLLYFLDSTSPGLLSSLPGLHELNYSMDIYNSFKSSPPSPPPKG